MVKERLNYLGLHRRDSKVQYTAISEVQNAIEVSCPYVTIVNDYCVFAC